MLYNERVELILQQVQLQAIVKINDLKDLLNVSVDTVRRDLKTMEQSGLIKCIRGGACLPDSLPSLSNFTGREVLNIKLKREAARKALAYIKPNAIIALNSGTTNTILAQELVFKKDNITVITNNLAAINILIQNPAIKIVSIGGIIDSQEKSTYGTTCEQEFGQYFPDIAFLSINAINYKNGFTDFRMSEIGIIKLLSQRSEKVIAIMDSSKIGKRSKQKVLNLDNVDLLLTDDNISPRIKIAIFLISHLEIWKMAIFYGIKLPFMLLHHEIVLYASKVFSTSIGSFPSNLPISTVLSQTLSLKPTFAPLVNDLPKL